MINDRYFNSRKKTNKIWGYYKFFFLERFDLSKKVIFQVIFIIFTLLWTETFALGFVVVNMARTVTHMNADLVAATRSVQRLRSQLLLLLL